MVAIRQPPEQQYFLLDNISWQTYEALRAEVGDRHLRMTYDDGELEIMTTSFGHDHVGRWLGRLIVYLAVHLKRPICSGGSTTLKRAMRRKGLEADECFWIEHERAMRDKKEWDVLVDPPPDLAVEVEISCSVLNRLGIYAALGVPEIWRYDGDSETLEVLALGADGKYRKRSKSPAFPELPLKKFNAFVRKLGTMDETSLYASVPVWLQENVPLKNQTRKNGNRSD
jgi:Uma2 family endonuclease